jgi:hypothetical protein
MSELDMFLEDVGQFRKYWPEKTKSWRLSKVRMLVRTYIEAGAEREVNLSHDMRTRTIQRALGTDTPLDLFDECAIEVEKLLRQGAWPIFLKEQRKMGKKGNVVVQSAV